MSISTPVGPNTKQMKQRVQAYSIFAGGEIPLSRADLISSITRCMNGSRSQIQHSSPFSGKDRLSGSCCRSWQVESRARCSCRPIAIEAFLLGSKEVVDRGAPSNRKKEIYEFVTPWAAAQSRGNMGKISNAGSTHYSIRHTSQVLDPLPNPRRRPKPVCVVSA